MYVYEYHLHSQNCNLTAIIILLAWVLLTEWYVKSTWVWPLVVYTRVHLNAGTASLYGLSFHMSSNPRILSKAELVILGSREI